MCNMGVKGGDLGFNILEIVETKLTGTEKNY